MHVHICAHSAVSVLQMCTLMSNKHLYNVYVCKCTSAENTCSKVHATLTVEKCTYVCTYTHMHTHTFTHNLTRMHINDTALHANASLLRLTIYAQKCIHIHIHRYIHAFVYIYTYTCIYIHIYMFVHVHTYTYKHVHTYTYKHAHIRHVHMHTRTHAWNDTVAATA